MKNFIVVFLFLFFSSNATVYNEMCRALGKMFIRIYFVKNSLAVVDKHYFMRLVAQPSSDPRIIMHEGPAGYSKSDRMYSYFYHDQKGVEWFTDATQPLDIDGKRIIEAHRVVWPKEMGSL